jgi:SNF2 family DNA or RNA helicase
MQREEVQSSNIKSIGYNPMQRKLEVEFKSGEVYRYKSVPRTVHKQMMSSRSKGSFLHHHIKYQYPYRKYKDHDGDFVKGEWKTLPKPVKKTAFDTMFDALMEKMARAKFTKDEAEAVLKKLDIDVTKEQWTIDDFVNGMNVELEHGTKSPATNITNDAAVTTAKIALAHLNEFPSYYKALDKMEASLKKSAFDLGFDIYVEKIAALNDDVELYPHQKKVVDSPETSKIIAHSVGGGKTLTAIAKFEKMKEDGKAHHALVVVPASLRENFDESGVKKFTDSKSNIVGTKQEIKSKLRNDIDPNADYNIMSYEMYRKDPARAIMTAHADTVITDEAHRGKNEGTLTTEQLKKYRPLYKNHIALTGSLVSNGVSDVHPLVDVVSGGKAKIGKNKDDFERQFVIRNNSKKYQDVKEKRRPIIGFHHPEILGPELAKYIDYEDYDDLKDIADMPDKKVKLKKVPISEQQAKM